jgi:hypothetical protein
MTGLRPNWLAPWPIETRDQIVELSAWKHDATMHAVIDDHFTDKPVLEARNRCYAGY